MRCPAELLVTAGVERIIQRCAQTPNAPSSAFCASGKAAISEGSMHAARTASRFSARSTASPTTLAAILNSLQMGFRTLAIEKRSSEVWMLLSAVKTEFGKFGDILDRTNKKLQEASNVMDDAARKSRTIERKLKGVQSLPNESAEALLAEAAEPGDGVDICPPV